MGKLKDIHHKSLQLLNDEPETTTSSFLKDFKSKNTQQVFLQQSVTLLALKDKTHANGTAAPNAFPPKLLFGVVNEDLPLFIGAVIGASLIIATCLCIVTLWKCCCRMTIWSKKKEYWLEPKNASSVKGKHKFPVVQSNSVVFLGLKPTRVFDYKGEKSSEDYSDTQPIAIVKTPDFYKRSFSEIQHIMSSHSPEVITSEAEKNPCKDSMGIPDCTCSDKPVNQLCSVISVPPASGNHVTTTNVPKASILSPNDVNIPNIIIHQDSPAIFHRNFYTGTFDQQSLYSCESNMESEFDLKGCHLTWSNYSLRPSSTSDCYYDLFQKASFCKKKKNRMRSDIAAAIALNRSQSSQLNKDTELLVENEVEVILDERTTL
ncbi:uncharacterized protein LOC129221901 [Uloborus diversus]|uniref:uncharacterized protein LOC129221901 n=1 Tax=Uloborus diversus TaxID=327109 RepID=UPI00240A864C|nr:uncharacterized protein LOC129221901 [Uloborus diversus]